MIPRRGANSVYWKVLQSFWMTVIRAKREAHRAKALPPRFPGFGVMGTFARALDGLDCRTEGFLLEDGLPALLALGLGDGGLTNG
jgi:hypothetical protein